MANAVFTTKISPAYDDLPESRYHFPQTYLNVARQAVGDWIVYYQPRREGAADSGRAGRQSYFAIARVDAIERDPHRADHHYARISDYLEFEHPIRFRSNAGIYLESGLRKADGSTNKGFFGRAVRLIPPAEFLAITSLGFADAHLPLVARDAAPEPETQLRARIQTLVSRPLRDRVFQEQVRNAYGFTCAMTGLKVLNAEGRPEVEAAHIRPVGDRHDGPDSPRNGIALSRTMHWLFDNRLVSVADDYRILLASSHVPERARRLFAKDLKLAVVPADPRLQPHPQFLRYHREHLFGV